METLTKDIVGKKLRNTSVLLHRDEERKLSLTIHSKSTLESLPSVDVGDDCTHSVHYRAAQVASSAYETATKGSKVLNNAKLGEIALVKFDELRIGEFLGRGSFSDVHEITKVTVAEVERADGDGAGSSGPRIAEYPREFLALNYDRKCDSAYSYRYAIKFLRSDVAADEKQYEAGNSDLVLEGMFLASLSHPNIIRIRGLPQEGMRSIATGKGYFLIIDRLHKTLGDKIYKEWILAQGKTKRMSFYSKKPSADNRGKTRRMNFISKRASSFPFASKKKSADEEAADLLERLRVAFDICGALQYLHSRNCIYRDLKPENLGFDVREDVKLFDLGLMKELRPTEADDNGDYNLSMAGTFRYMSPECANYRRYSFSSDVYSFSVLLWEIIALQKPYHGFDYAKLKKEVFVKQSRPPIKKSWKSELKSLVTSGWDSNPKKRPSMTEMHHRLKIICQSLDPDGKGTRRYSSGRRRSVAKPSITSTVSLRLLTILKLN